MSIPWNILQPYWSSQYRKAYLQPELSKILPLHKEKLHRWGDVCKEHKMGEGGYNPITYRILVTYINTLTVAYTCKKGTLTMNQQWHELYLQ